jgi:regulation of enolase protein 1 (concanavalin A-like superfamily)
LLAKVLPMERPIAEKRLMVALIVGACLLVFGWFRHRAPALVPDPPPSRSLEGWGEAYDPKGDCAVEVQGQRLTVTVPGSLHDLSAEQGEVSAPRVLRATRGDFVATVTVAGAVRSGGGQTARHAYPYHGAGLLLWQDSNHYVRLERAAILRGSQLIPYLNFEQRTGGRMVSSQATPIPDEPVVLRMERRGGRLFASCSPDAKRWTPLPEMGLDFAADLRVGVAAVNTATDAFKAEFDGLEITP